MRAHLGGVQVWVALHEQGRSTSNNRGGEAGARVRGGPVVAVGAGGKPGAVGSQRERNCALCGQCGAGDADGVAGECLRVFAGGDGEHGGRVRGEDGVALRALAGFVAGCGDDHHAFGLSAGKSNVQGLGVDTLGELGRLAGDDGDVDDVGAFVDGVVDSVGKRGQRACAGVVAFAVAVVRGGLADGDELRVRGNAVGFPGDDAGDDGAVRVAVGKGVGVVVVDKVAARDKVGELGVRVDAGVDDGDAHPSAGGEAVRACDWIGARLAGLLIDV